MAGFGDFKPQKLHKLLDVAGDLGLLVKVSEGRTFGIQSRYCLNHAGVCRCHEKFDLPLKTHLQEEHQEETLGRLRLYEPVMRLMPRLFKSGVVDTPCVLPMDPDDDPRGVVIDEDTSLADFLWLQARVDVLRHGLGTYRTRNGYPVSLIIATVGLHHGARGHRGQAENVPRALQDFSHDLLGVPSFLHGLTPAAPSGVVFIVIDRLAGLYVQRTFPDLPKPVVDCQGNIIEKLVLSQT